MDGSRFSLLFSMLDPGVCRERDGRQCAGVLPVCVLCGTLSVRSLGGNHLFCTCVHCHFPHRVVYTPNRLVLGPSAFWWPSFNLSLLHTKAQACRGLILGNRTAAALCRAASPGSGPGAGAGDSPAEETKRKADSAGANGRLHHLPGSTTGGGRKNKQAD